jgi:OOP family OmpA-OmpF porin
MKTTRALLLSGCLLALSACSGYRAHSEMQALNEAKAVGSPFTQALTEEYRSFSNHEMNQMFDYPDALHFARKGLAAAKGEVVMPEPISDWNLTPPHQEELGTARGRLIAAYDLGARDSQPQLSAHAQAKFDCWIEQQEEDWQKNDIVGCKSEFLDAMNQLEGLVGKSPAPAAAPVADNGPDMSQPMKAEDAMYLVFFDFDKSNVGTGGQSVVDAVAQEIKSRSLTSVNIVGNTDTSGSNKYNNKLAMRRANAVRDALIKRGVDASLINVTGRGEDNLLVQTPDGVREPANRRAEITFNGGGAGPAPAAMSATPESAPSAAAPMAAEPAPVPAPSEVAPPAADGMPQQ